jgi:hypothetical protein
MHDLDRKNAAPIAAICAALAIWAAVPYMPEPEPALAGFTLKSTVPDSGAITSPWPKPKIIRINASLSAEGAGMNAIASASAARRDLDGAAFDQDQRAAMFGADAR